MRTGVTVAALLTACIAASPLQAAPPQPPNINITPGNCNLTVINTGSRDQKVNIDTASCAYEDDPSKAIRIRYVWLHAASASVLLGGKVDGDLARVLGANPYVTKNKIYDEFADLVRRFGTNLAAEQRGSQEKMVVSTTLEGQQDTSSSTDQDLQKFRRRVGSPKIYNAEEQTALPEVDAYMSIQNTMAFPPNYSMFYSAGPVSAGDNAAAVLSTVTFWRELTADDLRNYTRDVGTLRSIIAQHKFKMSLDEALQPRNAKAWDERLNRTLSAMLHFARAGWPPNYLFAMGSPDTCGDDVGAFINVSPRKLYLQVAVLDNVRGRGVLPISVLKGEQIDTDRLRTDADDKDWTPLDLPF